MRFVGNIVILIISLVTLLISPISVFAQEDHLNEEVLETVVINIQEEKEFETDGLRQVYQKLELLVTGSNRKGEIIIVESGDFPVSNVKKYEVGDKLIVNATEDFMGEEIYFVSDYIRRSALYILFLMFVGLTILIGRKRGLASLLGMGLSFFVIFSFVLPRILAGNNPVIIAILASIIIIPVSFYLSHGFNKKTSSAIIGTLIALIITGILSVIFVELAKLTGFASEEVGFLQSTQFGEINAKGLLLAGIIIGSLGIFDDVTISQAAIVYQLKLASPKMSFGDLFNRTMDIGRDHIASMVNTLILVYTGAALPLLLLFTDSTHPFTAIIKGLAQLTAK